MKRAAVYVRVSTTNKSRQGDAVVFDQNPEVQEQPLRDLVAQRGWAVHHVYSDRASGAADSRPGLDALMGDARRGVFDVVIVWRFDRFARSVRQLILALEEFRSLRIGFISHQGTLDSSTPMGKAMFTFIAALAELERSLIKDRVIAGLEYARRHGTKSGRSIGMPRAVCDRSVAMQLRAKGKSWGYIALRLHTRVGSVRRDCQAGLLGETTPNLGQLPAIMPKTPEPVLDGVPRIGGDSIPSRSA